MPSDISSPIFYLVLILLLISLFVILLLICYIFYQRAMSNINPNQLLNTETEKIRVDTEKSEEADTKRERDVRESIYQKKASFSKEKNKILNIRQEENSNIEKNPVLKRNTENTNLIQLLDEKNQNEFEEEIPKIGGHKIFKEKKIFLFQSEKIIEKEQDLGIFIFKIR